MTLIPCRASVNLVGAKAGSVVLVDPQDPAVALYMEKGYLVAEGDAIAESGDGAGGEGDADQLLEPGSAVGDDAEAALETGSDSVDESTFPSA